jgi:hypothetical protein
MRRESRRGAEREHRNVAAAVVDDYNGKRASALAEESVKGRVGPRRVKWKGAAACRPNKHGFEIPVSLELDGIDMERL